MSEFLDFWQENTGLRWGVFVTFENPDEGHVHVTLAREMNPREQTEFRYCAFDGALTNLGWRRFSDHSLEGLRLFLGARFAAVLHPWTPPAAALQ